MVRSPCCDDRNLKKGPWTPEEDWKLVEHIKNHGYGSWRALPKQAGLNRCGKSCRLRWTNYLRPDIKRGKFSDAEEEMIIKLHLVLGNKWSRIAAHLPGRTDSEIKNFWNTHVKKKFLKMGLDPNTHQPRTDFSSFLNLSRLLSTPANFANLTDVLRLQTEAASTRLNKIQQVYFQNILQIINAVSVLKTNVEGANTLMGTHNLTLNTGDYPILAPDGSFPNAGVIPKIQNDHQAISNYSWAGIEGGLIRSEVVNFNNNCSSSTCHDILPIEKPLPALVSFSPESSRTNQMEIRKTNPAFASATTSSTSDIFEAWGELMDDETGGSYWKDILES